LQTDHEFDTFDNPDMPVTDQFVLASTKQQANEYDLYYEHYLYLLARSLDDQTVSTERAHLNWKENACGSVDALGNWSLYAGPGFGVTVDAKFTEITDGSALDITKPHLTVNKTTLVWVTK
jgi:hypothetical protein